MKQYEVYPKLISQTKAFEKLLIAMKKQAVAELSDHQKNKFKFAALVLNEVDQTENKLFG